ncbi:MAG TPA: PGPGW domain-containing protein [Candidatus Solibacter sp.]|jgi:hypothetical protein|nr:PGPGW domain-containing protein [Candidatus Solibacter sp.]
MKPVVLFAAGWLCILIGAAGLVLPFIPGAVLLIVGVTLLSQHYAWARRLLEHTRHRFPQAWSIDHYRATARRFWMRLRKGLHPVRLRGLVKYLVIVLAVVIEIIERELFHRVLTVYGINPADTVWDDIVIGATFGIVLFAILSWFDRAKEHEKTRARVIAEMNHHIRNALQVIQYGVSDNSALPCEYVREAIKRIEWALREVLPNDGAAEKYCPQSRSPDGSAGRKLAG